jgi:hypothetical protein
MIAMLRLSLFFVLTFSYSTLLYFNDLVSNMWKKCIFREQMLKLDESIDFTFVFILVCSTVLKVRGSNPVKTLS